MYHLAMDVYEIKEHDDDDEDEKRSIRNSRLGISSHKYPQRIKVATTPLSVKHLSTLCLLLRDPSLHSLTRLVR